MTKSPSEFSDYTASLNKTQPCNEKQSQDSAGNSQQSRGKRIRSMTMSRGFEQMTIFSKNKVGTSGEMADRPKAQVSVIHHHPTVHHDLPEQLEGRGIHPLLPKFIESYHFKQCEDSCVYAYAFPGLLTSARADPVQHPQTKSTMKQ